MNISYITCDFCGESTLTNKSAIMFTNVKLLNNYHRHICSYCICKAKEAMDRGGSANNSKFAGGDKIDRDFMQCKS